MPYVELQCRTNYSFLEGASHPEELVEQAAALGYGGLAVTDRNTLAGVVRAHGAAKDRAFPLIIGAEISLEDAPPVLLWAIDRAGYGRLSRLITVGRRRAAKGQCALRFDDLVAHHSGLLAGILAEPSLPGANCVHRIGDYRELFGDRCYWVCPLLRSGMDDEQLARFQAAARAWKLPLLAAGDCDRSTISRSSIGTMPRCWNALWKSRSAAVFRWTSCVTNILRNWRRPGSRCPTILLV